MRKFLIVLTIIFLMTGVALSQVAFKLNGGMAYISGNDLNNGIQGFNDWLAANATDATGQRKKLTTGMNFGGEILYNLTENSAIGLGINYFKISRNNEVSYTIPPGWPGSIKEKPEIKVIPITLNFYYFFPVSSTINLYIKIGGGYYLTTFDYEQYSSSIFGEGTDTLHVSKGVVGFQGGAGIEIPLASSISFIVEGSGRYATISELVGDWTSRGTSILGSWDKSGTGALWYGKDTLNGVSYPWIAVNPTAPGWLENPAVASLNISGFTASAGIKIGF